jgi:hypothetical protein
MSNDQTASEGAQMSQINVTQPGPEDREHARHVWAQALNNLSWALAAVMIIAALAIALVYVVQGIHA